MRDLTHDEEERIINRIASEVLKRGLEIPSIMFLESIKPVSRIGSQLSMFFIAPFLSIFGDLGVDYIKFFDKQENVEKLLQRIESEIKRKDEEKQKAKEQAKIIAEKFNFRLDLLPGFSIQGKITGTRLGSSIVGIERKDSAGGGLAAITFASIDHAPLDMLNEISRYLNDKDILEALLLSQHMFLKKRESKQNVGKLKGHKISMASYEWNNGEGKRGILETYGIWCDRTRRLFILGMRTTPMAEQKHEKDQIKDLRLMLGSIRCH